MSRRGEFNLQGMIIGTGLSALFVGLMIVLINSTGGSYDNSGYDNSTLEGFNVMSNLSRDIASVQSETEQVVVDKTVFDYLAGIFNSILSPFKKVYNSFKLFRGMTVSASESLKLNSLVTSFLTTMIVVLVLIGIVLIKFYAGKDKNR